MTLRAVRKEERYRRINEVIYWFQFSGFLLMEGVLVMCDVMCEHPSFTEAVLCIWDGWMGQKYIFSLLLS